MSDIEPQVDQRTLAKLLSVSVKTLSHWRRIGKGPQDWYRLSPTTIVYSKASVLAWIEERKAASHQIEELDASKTTFLADYRRKKAEAREANRG